MEKKFTDLIQEDNEWLGFIELKKIDKIPQRQDSLTDQMKDLYQIANKFGLYDAVDYIRKNFMKETL